MVSGGTILNIRRFIDKRTLKQKMELICGAVPCGYLGKQVLDRRKLNLNALEAGGT